MSKPVHVASSSLLAAQQQLQSLQTKHRAERIAAGLPVVTDGYGRIPQAVSRRPSSPTYDQLPAHLGWGSDAVTAVLRKRQQTSKDAASNKRPENRDLFAKPQTPTTQLQKINSTVPLYPDMALAMLRKELAAAGRIWLLLHHIDNVGRGWLAFEATREKLTGKKSDFRVCGWRQLRNLLTQGEGIFWERANGRIWLRSVAKAAAALVVERLTLKPIALPVDVLLDGMGQVRAHFYASFHSSRGKKEIEASPIARGTLARISHVPQRTQRFYEQRAKVKTKHNFAVGPAATDIGVEILAWRHGTAVFQLYDPDGRHGRKGRTYLAWQLPNNYTGPHAKQPVGRMKRINRELADLFMKGMTGNGEKKVEEKNLSRRFYGNGRLAARAFNQTTKQDIYWRRNGGMQIVFARDSRAAQPTNCQLWYVLSKGKK